LWASRQSLLKIYNSLPPFPLISMFAGFRVNMTLVKRDLHRFAVLSGFRFQPFQVYLPFTPQSQACNPPYLIRSVPSPRVCPLMICPGAGFTFFLQTERKPAPRLQSSLFSPSALPASQPSAQASGLCGKRWLKILETEGSRCCPFKSSETAHPHCRFFSLSLGLPQCTWSPSLL